MWDLLKKIIAQFLNWLRKIICYISCFFWSPPTYNPGKWNDGLPDADDCTCHIPTEVKEQYKNNCYNYGCDIKTNTFAQPGRASGNQYTSLTCVDVRAGAVSDGLKGYQDCDTNPPHCYHKVALVMAPYWDYHWYRQDDNGMWTHKPGKTAATNLDNNDNVINDPQTAARGPYTEFCGCFWVRKCDVIIE